MHLAVPEINLHITLRKILTRMYFVEFLEFEAIILHFYQSQCLLQVCTKSDCASTPCLQSVSSRDSQWLPSVIAEPRRQKAGHWNWGQELPVPLSVTSSSGAISLQKAAVFFRVHTGHALTQGRDEGNEQNGIRCLACTATDSWVYLWNKIKHRQVTYKDHRGVL